MEDKKKPNAPKKVPTPIAKETNKEKPAVQKTVDFKNMMETMSLETARGLDPNHQVDLLNLAHDIYGKDPNATTRYKMKTETVEKINHIVAIGVAVAMARETLFAKNEFACLMNKAALEEINEMCREIGISVNTKMLPEPNKEGTIEVPSSAIEVSEETKKKLEEEESIRNTEVVEDPTKIENEEQLIVSLKHILVTRDNAYRKINDALNFYQAYQKIAANKAENKEEALKEINDKSRVQLLKEMAKLIGACPLVLNGVGRYMYNVTAQSKSPITAFCLFRNTTKNKKNGTYALTDTEIADYVRTLIEWTQETKVSEEKKRIEDLKSSLEVLKKDEKKNAAGIDDVKVKIEAAERNIKHFGEILAYVLTPSAETLDSIITGYENKDTAAVRTFKAISDSYYDEYNIKEMKTDIVRHNLAQYAGIITNLFRDPSAQLDQYSKSNLMQLEPIVPATEKEGSKKE